MGCFGSKDKLSKEDMDFLKSHTRYDEATIKEWYKGFKQDCPNGRLTPAKFVDMYKMFFPSGNAEEFCDHVFRTFDMDKNGYIDFKEFLLAIDVTSSGTPEEKLKWAFRMYDVDGNGVIDMQEMTKIVQAIYDMLGACSSNRPADSAEERAKNIFAKMDENNDGQLTQDEFLKGCLQDEELTQLVGGNKPPDSTHHHTQHVPTMLFIDSVTPLSRRFDEKPGPPPRGREVPRDAG
ncbi:hypothetical protein HN011_012195 [Eciton burchellii]|nr:hypothetical protein HN011_012195 [Eciton burchellii]